MRAQFVVASLGAHALALAAMARFGAAPAPVRPAIAAPLEVAVLERVEPVVAPAPAVAPEPPPEPSRTEPSPPRAPERPPSRRAVEGAAPKAAAPEPAPDSALSMRREAERRPETPTTATPEVNVPRAWEIGKPEGPPPSDRLPAGALGGEIRPPDLPGPFYRTGVSTRGERLGERVVADGDGGYREDRMTFKARVDRDGSVHFKDRANVQVDSVDVFPLLIFMGGHFDLTDKLMQMHGEDPYRYEKAKFMERTRDERAQMALGERGGRFVQALVRMPKYLGEIWREPRWSVAERKLAIFALWEEVAEEGDDELVAFGGKIREEIVSFIRRQLPRGSAQAYSPDELQALNARRKCKARFAPYGED